MNKLLKGLDQQGRYPEAAEAATEIGMDYDDAPETLGTLVLAGVLVVAVVGVSAFLVGVLV